MKVTISQAELHKYIEQQDLERLTIFFDLEDGSWFEKHSTQWRDVPATAIRIPCYDPDGSGKELEMMEDHLDIYSGSEQHKFLEAYRLDFDLHYLDLFEALDAGEVKGIETQDWKYESPPEGWVKGWEEYKEMHIEFLADEWLNSLKKNDWKELADFMPEELKDLEIELTVLSY